MFPEKKCIYRRIILNTLYTKVLLYTYPNISSLIDQIDELVEKKAISSMDSTLPCIEICNSVINLIKEKDLYLKLMVVLEDVLKTLSEEEMLCVEYKYFLEKDKFKHIDFDYTSKQYFRSYTHGLHNSSPCTPAVDQPGNRLLPCTCTWYGKA